MSDELAQDAAGASDSGTKPGPAVSRRGLLVGAGLAAGGFVAYPLARRLLVPPSPVFIAANQKYDGDLVRTIRDGLTATGLHAARFLGKKVLLKPNMVEPTRERPHMTTHPAMVRAAADVFRSWGASVSVGEAPGHVRDTEWALYESRIGEALESDRIPFADLNYEEVGFVENKGRISPLPGLFFPRTVLEADFVVSMPKMKTHHWVGLTVSMKNLYGTLPGIKYGWPKNVLHHAGIPETVVDINASLPKTLAIVDAITCMEGDGPILGSPKEMGLVLIGPDPISVDATAARIMGLEPTRVSYLALAQGVLGPLAESRIDQRGERWKQLLSPFTALDEPHLNRLRAGHTGVLTS
jgi:uncharacterized protein (DUF362 family)